VTINAHRVSPIDDRTPSVDSGGLEQFLRLQESLLSGDVGAAQLGGRICQGAAVLLRMASARLALLDGDRVETVAAYGATEFPAVAPGAVRQALAEGVPALPHPGGADEPPSVTIPLHAGEVPVLLQLVGAPARHLTVDDVALARYAASLAAIALRLGAQRERLEQSSTAKSELLVAMSHDLRSPLNVLIGYARLLAEDTFGPCSGEQREALGSIERYALELLSLLSGVLDLARLDTGREQPRREEFALAEVFDELRGGSLGRRGAEGVEVAWQVDPELPPIHSDRFRVRQILQNLVDNALRFTESGSVRVRADRAADGVRLTVRDTGPGIAADDLPHLFELFRPGRAGRASGTGCGLYLVKRYSESLGGHVAVDSRPGEGTCFTIELPLGG
jgi:signal transduction histidine kinase